MDWPRARAVLLLAFTLVNLILAYDIWGPKRTFPAFAEPSVRSQTLQLQARLADQGLELPAGVAIPATPGPMTFLRVEYHSDPSIMSGRLELFQGIVPSGTKGGTSGTTEGALDHQVDPETRAVLYDLKAMGNAAREVNLEDRAQVRQVAEEFLQAYNLLYSDAQLSGLFPTDDGGQMVEFVPRYQGLPVYSGYIRVYLSSRGIERVVQHWVRPVGLKEGPSKAVRPAAEALLRLAGHLAPTGKQMRQILDVRLGYYSGPSVTVPVVDRYAAWETVPVWRITLDNGLIYYVNAFNGELES